MAMSAWSTMGSTNAGLRLLPKQKVQAKHTQCHLRANILCLGVARGELPSIWCEINGMRDSLSWERNARATTYINELLQAPQTEVGSLAVIKMKITLQQDEQRTTSTLVVPSGTRGSWGALLNDTKEEVAGQAYVVIGTPGVGKSRSLNYLIREIISKHRNKGSLPPAIVFEHRKDGFVWLFVPRERENPQSEYEAYIVGQDLFAATRAAVLFDKRNYYIVDSGKAEEAKTPLLVPAKTIYSCSPDYRHFSEFRRTSKASAAGIESESKSRRNYPTTRQRNQNHPTTSF